MDGLRLLCASRSRSVVRFLGATGQLPAVSPKRGVFPLEVPRTSRRPRQHLPNSHPGDPMLHPSHPSTMPCPGCLGVLSRGVSVPCFFLFFFLFFLFFSSLSPPLPTPLSIHETLSTPSSRNTTAVVFCPPPLLGPNLHSYFPIPPKVRGGGLLFRLNK